MSIPSASLAPEKFWILPVITVFEAGETYDRRPVWIRRSIARRQTSLFETSFAPGESNQGAFLEFTAPESGFYDVVVSTATVFGDQTMSFFDFGGGLLAHVPV